MAAKTDAEKEILEEEFRSLEEQKAEIEQRKKRVQYREQFRHAGYVYVISNIGTFGEEKDVYKIGVSLRDKPEERVDELSDAAVPFDFDIHAMIFSADAYALENALHKALMPDG